MKLVCIFNPLINRAGCSTLCPKPTIRWWCRYFIVHWICWLLVCGHHIAQWILDASAYDCPDFTHVIAHHLSTQWLPRCLHDAWCFFLACCNLNSACLHHFKLDVEPMIFSFNEAFVLENKVKYKHWAMPMVSSYLCTRQWSGMLCNLIAVLVSRVVHVIAFEWVTSALF